MKCSGKAEKTTLGIPCRLLSFRSDARDRPLGPLAMLQYIDRDSWCTLSLLPESSSNSTITIWDVLHDRASRVHSAMRCRGFTGQFRTLAEDRTTWADAVLLLATVAIGIGLVLWDRRWWPA